MTKGITNEELKQFLKWIRSSAVEYPALCIDEQNHFYRFYAQDAVGEVNLYPQDTVEMRITDTRLNETKFFLHFGFTDLNRAKQLYNEMCDVMHRIAEHRQRKILLCCTSALTTSYFAEKLNETAEVLNSGMQFEATDIHTMYQKAQNYDLVLLAPQAAYLYDQANQILRNIRVCRIPPDIFGMYDTSGLIAFARTKLEKTKVHGEEEGIYIRKLKNRYQVLSIAVVCTSDHLVHIGSYVFDHGEMIRKQETIKEILAYKDIEDVIRNVLHDNHQIQGIGISVPGIVDHGIVNLPEKEIVSFDMKTKIEETFRLPVTIENDVNAAALGIDSQQEEYRYKTILYHFQPLGSVEAGQGLVANHHLHHGHKSFSGELKYLISGLKWSGNPEDLIWTPDGASEIIAGLLTVSVCTESPDLICLNSVMSQDLEEIRKRIQAKIPEEYIPEIRYVQNQQEYMALGAALLCARNLDESN